MIYANALRLYEGEQSLFTAASKHKTLTVNTSFSCGGVNGTWSDEPFLEIRSKPRLVPAEVQSLALPAERNVDDPVPLLYEAVVGGIAKAWRTDAFHVVFHSSGWDSRILSAAIRYLLTVNTAENDDWLGQGLLFVSNRWEARQFAEIMEAQGWSPSQWVAYDEHDADNHFRRGQREIWRSAPLPIPGNLWQYIPQWAKENGLLPRNVPVQAFTGLWANEAWNCFLMDDNPWVGRVNGWYSWNTMASLPVDADFVEYPLVSTDVLEILRRVRWEGSDGDSLRKAVALYASPETAGIPNLGLDDRRHKIGSWLRKAMDDKYKATYFGGRVGWIPPTDSNFSTEWGRYSTAMLVEELRKVGVDVR